jgi:hypothetical protein
MRNWLSHRVLLLVVFTISFEHLGYAEVPHEEPAAGRPSAKDVETAIKEVKGKWDQASSGYNYGPYLTGPYGVVCVDPENKAAMAATIVSLPGVHPQMFTIVPHPLITNPFQLRDLSKSWREFVNNRALDRDWQKFQRLQQLKESAAAGLVYAQIQERAASKRDRPLVEIEKAIDDATKDPMINSLAQPAIVDSYAASVRANMRGTDPEVAKKALEKAQARYQKSLKPYTDFLENPKIKGFQKEEANLTRPFDEDKDQVLIENDTKTEQGSRYKQHLPRRPFFGMAPTLYYRSKGSQWLEFEVTKPDRTEVAGKDRVLMKYTQSTTESDDGQTILTQNFPMQWEHYVDGVKRTLYCN